MTDQGRSSLTVPPKGSGDNASPLYPDAGAALKAVNERYHYWTEKLTDSSFQLSLAVIATNWAVFGSVDKILKNPWAQWSIAVVLIGLGLNLLGTKFMGELLRERVCYAESNPARWEKEFIETSGRADPWPYTHSTDCLSRFLRECKTWAPILGGGLFIFGLAQA